MSKNNYDLIEGPWGKFTFRRTRPEDVDKVVKHYQDYFLRDEPMAKLIGYTDQCGEEWAQLVKRFAQDNISFWVEDNETGEVAAVRTTFRHKKDFSVEGMKFESTLMKTVFQVLAKQDERCDLFKHYNIEEYADFFGASCATKYRKQGITGEMYRRCLAFLKAEGFKMCTSIFTSPFTRAAARRLGFEEVARVDMKELVDNEGKPVFNEKDLTDEHYVAILCKRL